MALLLTALLAQVAFAVPQADFKAYEDYKKDMIAAGQGAMNFTGFTQAWSKFQHFQNYLHKKGSESPFGFHSFVGEYDKFMDFQHYLGKGAEHQKDESANFKDFLDFEKFLSFSHQGHGQHMNFPGAPVMMAAAGGDDKKSKHEDSQDADDQGFGGFAQRFVPAGTTDGGPKGGLSGVTADFHKYMDYSKYMNMSHQYTQKDWMSEWHKFANQSQQQNAPYNAKDCKTKAELDAWRDKQTDIAKTWIPPDYQGPTLQSIQKDYDDNLDRIKNGGDDKDAAKDSPALAAEPAPAVALQAAPLAAVNVAPRPSARGARAAGSVSELVAWRGRMAQLAEQLPKEEQAEWNQVLDGEMKAALDRMTGPKASKPVTLMAEPEAKPRSRMLELSRTMLVFVVSFSVPVAGVYVYRAMKQASAGTDLDAAFLSMGEP